MSDDWLLLKIFKYHFMGVGQWSLAEFIEFSDFNDQLSA